MPASVSFKDADYRKQLLAQLKRDGLNWTENWHTPELLNDKEFVIEAATANGHVIHGVAEELEQDREVILAAISGKNYGAFQNASQELLGDKSFMLEAVKAEPFLLKSVRAEWKNDKEVVLAAVERDGTRLRYASQAMQSDKDVVMAAVSSHGCALQYASEEWQNDKEVVLAAMQRDGMHLQYASQDLRNDKEIVFAAVSSHGSALRFASEELQNDREMLLEAVSTDILALRYASEELLGDDALLQSILDEMDADDAAHIRLVRVIMLSGRSATLVLEMDDDDGEEELEHGEGEEEEIDGRGEEDKDDDASSYWAHKGCLKGNSGWMIDAKCIISEKLGLDAKLLEQAQLVLDDQIVRHFRQLKSSKLSECALVLA